MNDSRRSMNTALRAARGLMVMLLCSAAATACTDEGEPTGSGGAGGDVTTGGSGGAGASAGGGAGGATSTGGGGAAACLPESVHAGFFTLEAEDLCALGVYTAAGSIVYQQPTWGSHGGPLLVAQGANDGEVALSRWTPPSGQQGEMEIATTTVDAKIPAGTFVGGVAADLGFRPGTVISYQGAFPDTEGEMIVLDGTNSDERYAVNGLFSLAVLASADSGRLLHSGLSPLGDAMAGPNGLYAADDCAGSFDPGGAAGCNAPSQIAAWGDASGPVAADAQGNVIVVMTNFSGDQVGRAFAASAVAAGEGSTSGDVLFGLDGFGQSLAAIAPSDGAPGIVAFQPSDGATFEALDVLVIRYEVAAGQVMAQGNLTILLKLATPNTPVAMLTDPENRLWVGLPTANGTTFVVLGRKP